MNSKQKKYYVKCKKCVNLNKRIKAQDKNWCNKKFGILLTDKKNKKYFCYENCNIFEEKINLKKIKRQVIDDFQMYIRYRDDWTCCCCGKKISPKVKNAKNIIHAGHYITRRIESLLLDEKNVHAQCKLCNGKQNWIGVDPRYTKYIIQKNGTEVLDYFISKFLENKKYTIEDWIKLKDYWANKLLSIKK